MFMDAEEGFAPPTSWLWVKYATTAITLQYMYRYMRI